MTVDKLGDNKLLIKLDESDMENFELDFGKMSFKNEDNQKVAGRDLTRTVKM